MSYRPRHAFLALLCLAAGAAGAFAQALPTSQPKLLQIYREQVKAGHAAAHAKTESGWPAAFAKAQSPDFYLALASMTGPQVVWFLSPWDSYATWGKSMARDESNAALSAELERLSAADRRSSSADNSAFASSRCDDLPQAV